MNRVPSFPLDAQNRKLLTALRRDTRTKYADLGKEIHLSPPAVFERVKRLERSGVIERFSVELNAKAMGLPLCAFVRIRTHHRACGGFGKALQALPEIEECHSIAGEDCILIKVRVADTEALEALLQKVRGIDGVERTLTTVVLLTQFERGVQVP